MSKKDANAILVGEGKEALRQRFDDAATRADTWPRKTKLAGGNSEDRQEPAPKTAPSRDDLLVSAWRKRDIPPRDFLLGGVFCATSRWIIYGDTGVGKTLIALDLAGAMAAMAKFLDWEGTRKIRIMVIDGEMPAETFKERMTLIGDLYGNDIAVYGYNRDDLISTNKGVDVMHPLDTELGQRWLWREIEIIKPDVIIFDSIKYLLGGIMSEEESWSKVEPLIGKLTNRHIGQIWLHHTGHDTTKSFGTKTREWAMEAVVSLTKTEADMRILMEFKKARPPHSEDRVSVPAARDRAHRKRLGRGRRRRRRDQAEGHPLRDFKHQVRDYQSLRQARRCG